MLILIPTYVFYLDANSPVIGGTRISPTEVSYATTTNYQHLSYEVPINNDEVNDWAGYNFVLSQDYNAEVFAYALYKFSIQGSDYHFYIDYRDERAGSYQLYSPPTSGHDMDIWFKYDGTINKIYYSSYGDNNWHLIENGEYLAFWEIKAKGNPVTTHFPSGLWDHVLFLLPSNENHPQLVWTAYQATNVIGYKLIREVSPIPGNSMTHTFTLSGCNYIDNDFTIGSPNWAVTYYVKAIFSDYSLSTASNNTVERGDFNPSKKLPDQIYTPPTIDKYKLTNNYPNPFNPMTQISYSIPVPDFVTLKVYNSIGKEVQVLVNNYQGEGSYSIPFNAENLPSGIYYYTLKTNNYTSTKKMLLVK